MIATRRLLIADFLLTMALILASPLTRADQVPSQQTPPPPATSNPMTIIFLGDIYRIGNRQIDLQEDVLKLVEKMKPGHIAIRICPLIADEATAGFRAALLKVYSGELSIARLPRNAVECARNRLQ